MKPLLQCYFWRSTPILSVNGNVAVLCPEDLSKFSKEAGIPLEINLFYRKPGRIEAITSVLNSHGVTEILGVDEEYFEEIDEISSQRRVVDKRGIGKADVVFVPLEDGDRTEGLVNKGTRVITVDLNPLSRTALKSHITIVDNIIRAMPLIHKEYQSMTVEKAKKVLQDYDNQAIIKSAMTAITQLWKEHV